MDNLTIVVPFWQGHDTINGLLESLPDSLPIVIVDDRSDEPLQLERENVQVIRPIRKGYFAGAVNVGVNACQTDVLVLNQDVWFEDDRWMGVIADNRDQYATIGEGVMAHPAWPKGYVQGTFMFVRRGAWAEIGGLDEALYPLWGGTCEWQLRACRAGYKALPLDSIPGMGHEERERGKFGSAITEALKRWPQWKWDFIKTPPEVSVIVPCYNYGRYLDDCLNSLLGGPTSLGEWEPQTFKSFEVIIVDDASTDGETRGIVKSWHRPEIGVKVVLLNKNLGTPGAINAGIERSYGRFIHVLSADDMRENWALEKFYRHARRYPHSMIYGDIQTFKNGQRDRILKLNEYDFDEMLTRNPIPAGSMYHRLCWEEAGGYPDRMVYGREDWAFNIAAGSVGYCGRKMEGLSGNLCRRERQNRSLRTSTKEWRQRFLDQLEALYPAIYRGERPVACCGGRRQVSAKPAPATVRAIKLTGRKGMVLIRYVGGGDAKRSFFGGKTGQRYQFSANPPHNIGYVAVEDYEELLATYAGRNAQFSPYTPPPKEVKEVKAPETPEEIEPPVERDEIPDDVDVIEIDATGAAKRLAEGYDIDLAGVEGTGKDGRITAEDVRKLLV